MSVDKFAVTRAGLAEFERSLRTSDFFAEDFVWDFSEMEGWIEDSEYRGRAAFDVQMERWTEPFESWSWELSELIDAGGDDILAVGMQRGVLKGSGTPVVMPIAQIWTVGDGKLRRIRMFLEPAHAYRAAGLLAPSEQRSVGPGSSRASGL